MLLTAQKVNTGEILVPLLTHTHTLCALTQCAEWMLLRAQDGAEQLRLSLPAAEGRQKATPTRASLLLLLLL